MEEIASLFGEEAAPMITSFLDKYGGQIASTGLSGAAMVLPQLFMMRSITNPKISLPNNLAHLSIKAQEQSVLPELPDMKIRLKNTDQLENNTKMYGYDILNGNKQDVQNAIAYKIANHQY